VTKDLTFVLEKEMTGNGRTFEIQLVVRALEFFLACLQRQVFGRIDETRIKEKSPQFIHLHAGADAQPSIR